MGEMGWKQYMRPENWHEAARAFPLLEMPDLEKLAASIRKHGLQNPIALLDGKVLDGRNRVLACALLHEQGYTTIEPEFYEWTPKNGISPTMWVLAQNLERRHLNKEQRGLAAAKLVPLLAEEAAKRKQEAGKHYGRGRGKAAAPAERNLSGGESVAQAAKLLKVRKADV